MKSIIVLCLVLTCNLSFAKEKKSIEIVHDPFSVFYPHFGNSICRIEAFEIAKNKSLNKEKKIKAWNKYKNFCSKDGSYQLILADLYTTYKNYKASKKILEKAIQNTIYDTRHHKSHLHEVYVQLGEIKRSIDLAMTTIKDYPDFDGGYESLAVNYCKIKDWVNAKKYLEKAVLLNNKNAYTYRLLTRVAYELREDDKVHLYYEKAFLIDPFVTFSDRSSSLSMLAVFINEKKFEEAETLINNQLEFDPNIKDDHRFIIFKKYCENELKKQDQNN